MAGLLQGARSALRLQSRGEQAGSKVSRFEADDGSPSHRGNILRADATVSRCCWLIAVPNANQSSVFLKRSRAMVPATPTNRNSGQSSGQISGKPFCFSNM